MLSLANFFRTAARIGILLICGIMLSYIIFEGAMSYGITIRSIIGAIPNALPWFMLLLLLLLAWDFELISGILMLLFGLIGIFYMSSTNSASVPQTTILLAIIVFAIFFILSWVVRRIYSLSYA